MLFKSLAKQNINKISIYPSNDWMINSFGAESTFDFRIVDNKSDEELIRLAASLSNNDLIYAVSLTEKRRRRKQIHDDRALKIIDIFNAELTSKGFDKNNLYIERYKSPLSSIPPSKLSFSINNSGQRGTLGFGYRPVSKELIDRGTELFTLQESVLGSFHGSIDLNSNNISLNQLTVFSMKSIVPYNHEDPQWSFDVGLSFSHNLENDKIYVLQGLTGTAIKPHSDIKSYLLIGGGVGHHDRVESHAFGKLSAGLYFNLVMDARLHVSFDQTLWNGDRNRSTEATQITFQKSLGLANSISLSYRAEHNRFRTEMYSRSGRDQFQPLFLTYPDTCWKESCKDPDQ